MNSFYEQIERYMNFQSTTSLTSSLTAIVLSFLLSIVVTQLYKHTFQGSRYSQSFVHTIIIMSVVVSIVMIVIGNNVAVAFGLVGAFSIIRFRSAMNDPKDIAFIFFGMASGIACGLGFFVLAVLFTVVLSIFIYSLYVLDYGKKKQDQLIVKITVPENLHFDHMFDNVFGELLEQYKLMRVETTSLGTMFQLEYDVRYKSGVTNKQFMDAVREKNANLKVSVTVHDRIEEGRR